MRQKSLLILLTAALLSAGLSACGTKNNSDSDTGLEISPISDDGDSAGTETENPQDASQAGDTAENTADDSDTDVISDISGTGQQGDEDNPVSVTFEKSIDEIKSDDGTVICTNSVQMPVVRIEGAEDIAEKSTPIWKNTIRPFPRATTGLWK